MSASLVLPSEYCSKVIGPVNGGSFTHRQAVNELVELKLRCVFDTAALLYVPEVKLYPFWQAKKYNVLGN